MADVKALLTKKVGPLPVGVWVAAVAGGLYMARRRSSSGQPDAAAGLAGSTGLTASSATQNGDTIETPDAGNVVVSPIMYLPELPAPAVVPDPGEGLYDAPEAPWAPAETYAPLPEPVLTEASAPAAFRPPVPGSSSTAKRYAEQSRRYARKAFIQGHPELRERMDEPKRKAKFLSNHKKISRNLRKLSKPVR